MNRCHRRFLAAPHVAVTKNSTSGDTQMKFTRKLAVAVVVAIAAVGTIGLAHAAESGKVGLGLPMLTSPFWQSYNNYLPKYAKEMGIDILAPVNSNGDPAQQITDM